MRFLVAMALVLMPMTGICGLHGHFGITSTYVWRGIPVTENQPAVQGKLAYAHASGVEAGMHLSNAGQEGTEVEYHGRYTQTMSKLLTVYGGSNYYQFTKRSKHNSVEFTGGAMTEKFEVSVSMMPRYMGTSSASLYSMIATQGNLWSEEKLTLGLAIGLSIFSKQAEAGSKNYSDFRISIDRNVGEWTTSFFYTDTNRILASTNKRARDGVIGIGAERSI